MVFMGFSLVEVVDWWMLQRALKRALMRALARALERALEVFSVVLRV